MRKTYVLDTSTLIYDPAAYKHFVDSNILIPICVLNELDQLKKHTGEVGKNARTAIKLLDNLSNQGNISSGILLDNNINLKVDTHYFNTKMIQENQYEGFGDPSYGDTQILICAYAHNVWANNVVLVSNDINLRVKAKSRGIDAIGHNANKLALSDVYSGVRTLISEEAAAELQQKGYIYPAYYDLNDLSPNEYVAIKNDDAHTLCIGRKIADKIKLVKNNNPWDIKPRNLEQICSLDLLMDKNVDLVTFIGKAGTGKTLMTLAAALELVINRKTYNKFVIYRPIQPVGNDLGYLPGDLSEKLAPWFQAIMDNMETLLSFKNGDNWKRLLEQFMRRGSIEMEAITYIRGRSIPKSIIFVDECQNLSKEEIKTVLTRAGENTKVILNGDIEQIDNASLDAANNGLTYVIDKFKHSQIAGHVTFVQGERSKLATIASELL
jgi:PhoH-like ATPase